jgi:acyl-coenzyme A synthetase/AMP-(fatty) acid ligase
VLENRPHHLAVLVGVIATGRCVVTLSPLQPAERQIADIRRSGVPAVIASPAILAQEGVREAIEESGLCVELGPSVPRLLGGTVNTSAQTRDGVVIEMLTSGTTGPPKRIQLGEAQFDKALQTSVPAPAKDHLFRSGVTMVATPMVHIGGMWSAVGSLYSGRKIALMQRFRLDTWVRAIERHRPRASGLVPAAVRAVLDAGIEPEKLSSLQVITCGTTFCPPELAKEFQEKYGIRVLMTYGATEFAGAVASWTLPMHEKYWPAKAGSAGRAMPGVDLRVTNAEGEVLPAGEVGYLEIRTAQAPQGPDAWVRTSDLARLDVDGFLFIEGRADDTIIRGGFKIQPGQVAKVLERHPAVREASVAPMPDRRLGQVPVAGVEVVSGSARPTMQELIRLCRDGLLPYEVPVHVVVLDELPRTAASKVSRMDLLELVRDSMAREVTVN